jgi:RNA polymerase sigma factor (sigma-70 family)
MESSDFDRFYACHFALSYMIALQVTRNPTDAQDVAQSVFCNVWARRDSQSPSGPGRTWLSVVTRNAAVDYLRSRNRREHIWKQLSLEASAESAETACLRNIEASHVWSVLDQIGDDRRSLIQESFVRRWSHARIAGSRNIALGTVKTRIRAGLHTMRRIMDSPTLQPDV